MDSRFRGNDERGLVSRRAIAEYRKALRLNLGKEDARIDLGSALCKSSNADAGTAEYLESPRRNPGNELEIHPAITCG